MEEELQVLMVCVWEVVVGIMLHFRSCYGGGAALTTSTGSF